MAIRIKPTILRTQGRPDADNVCLHYVHVTLSGTPEQHVLVRVHWYQGGHAGDTERVEVDGAWASDSEGNQHAVVPQRDLLYIVERAAIDASDDYDASTDM